MLIAIPSCLPGGLDANMGMHFGHCDIYTLVDIEDGAVKEVPIMLFRPDHIASRGAHLPFPGYTWTQAGYIVIPEEAEMVRMVYRLYAEGMKIEHIRKEVEAEAEAIKAGNAEKARDLSATHIINAKVHMFGA